MLDAGRPDPQLPWWRIWPAGVSGRPRTLAGLAAGDTVVIRSHGELKSVLDDLEARGVRCVNATCPNVIRIQRLVAQAEAEGRRPVIIGDPLHPEVMGVASWCRQPLVFDGPEAVEAWLDGERKVGKSLLP